MASATKVISVDRLVVTPYSQKVNLVAKPPSGRRRSSYSQRIPSASNRAEKENEDQTALNELKAKIGEKMTNDFAEVKKFFQLYDRTESFCVTKSDLRKVLLDAMDIKVSDQVFEQLCSGLEVKRDGTINYLDFMDKGFNKESMKESEKWLKLMHNLHQMRVRMTTQSPQPDVGMDKMEKNLREKISLNLPNIMRAFHLFDYNRDEHIQKHEMRKVLENYCFRMTDNQFERLWSRYDLTRSGITNYKEFLHRLGINVNNQSMTQKRPSSAGKLKRSKTEVSVGLKVAAGDLYDSRAKSATLSRGANTADPYRFKTFEELEKEFRRLMKRNLDQIVKTCQAFDPHRENAITIENLRNILSRFTIPLNDELFNRLLTHCGIKATGEIAWAQFVDHFADQFRYSKMANSLPIKPAHQMLPHKHNKSEQLTGAQLIGMMRGYVEKNYESMKAAFLAFDPDRKGKIMRKELRKIVENYCLKLSEDQFKELIIMLDPHHLGFIDYHQFLGLFELQIYPDEQGPKWLDSEYGMNPPKVLEYKQDITYATVEEILRQKLTENARHVAQYVVKIQAVDTPDISRESLGHIITKFALPLSEEHLDNLWNKMEHVDGKVSFNTFMNAIGMDTIPGDVTGLSSIIALENEKFLEERQLDHETRLRNLAMNNVMRTSRMPLDEVCQRIRENIYQRNAGIRDEFMRYDADKDGKVTKAELRKILNSFGLPLDFVTFDALCQELRFPKEGMTYMDFLSAFQDPRIGGPGAEISNSTNYKRPDPAEDVYQLADSVVPQLKSKIMNNHDSLREAFFKGDHGRKGYWDRNDFRRLLDKHMFFIENDQFDRLMQIIGLSQKGRILYKEFVELFQDAEETTKYQESSHTVIEPTSPSLMAAEQVFDIMKMKASSRFHDFTRAFQTLEKNSEGAITKADFRKLLWKFNLPMSHEEFEKLWRRYDIEGVGSVSFHNFSRLMGLVFGGNDQNGMSKRIIEDNAGAIDAHLEGQRSRQVDIAEKQMIACTSTLTATQIEKQLREKFTDNFAAFYRAFRNCDVKGDGYVTIDELFNIISKANFVMDKETFVEVLKRLGLPTSIGKVNYERFLKNIDSSKRAEFVPKTDSELLAGLEKPAPVAWQRTDNWSANKVVEVLKSQVTSIAPDLLKAFQSFDAEDSGRIKATDFRRIIESFCFPLKDSQFKGLIQHLHLYQDLTLSYLQFLDNFVASEDANGATFSEMQRVKTPKPMQGMSFEEVSQRLREIVTSRFYDFVGAFKDIDYGQLGVIRQDDFRRVLHALAFRLLDEQFEGIVCKVVTDQGGNVDYRDFLKEFSNEGVPTPSSPRSQAPSSPPEETQVLKRPRTANAAAVPTAATGPNSSRMHIPLNSSRPGSARLRRPKSAAAFNSQRSGARSPMAAPGILVNAEQVEAKLKEKVMKHWKSIQHLCRVMDPKSTGCVTTETFKDILRKYKIDLTDEEISTMQQKYTTDSNDFAYTRFLRQFVILIPKNHQSTDIIYRNTSRASDTDDTGMDRKSGDLQNLVSRLRDSVKRDWKSMRREFKSFDVKNTAAVSVPAFRQVLKSHNMNLNEDEFFLLCDHCDTDMSGRVNYNDFLRICLK